MKPFTTTTAVLLIIVAVVHALRLWQGWNITIDGTVIPLWASAVGLVIAGGLAVGLWREAR